MFFRCLEKSSKKKETRIKKELVEVLRQASYRRKRTENWKIGMMKFLALTLYLLVRTISTSISSSAIIDCLQRKQNLNLESEGKINLLVTFIQRFITQRKAVSIFSLKRYILHITVTFRITHMTHTKMQMESKSFI